MSARLTQADLDAHIANKEEPFYAPNRVVLPVRPLCGENSRDIGAYVPSLRTDIRKTFDAVRAGDIQPAVCVKLARTPRSEQRTVEDVWRDAEAATAGDAHVRAMAETPARRATERRHRIVDGVLFLLFVALLVAAVLNWLPGGAR